jgi:hypothetical protein
LRFWLRGRNGVIVLIVLAVVIGAALNWSWLVAAGIAPLLVTVLPCAAMCALGLCMNKMAGGLCSTETRSVETRRPDLRVAASVETAERGCAPLPSDKSAPPARPAISLTEPSKVEERS